MAAAPEEQTLVDDRDEVDTQPAPRRTVELDWSARKQALDTEAHFRALPAIESRHRSIAQWCRAETDTRGGGRTRKATKTETL
jgi:hypothetical protein